MEDRWRAARESWDVIDKSSHTTLAVLLERVKDEIDTLTTIVGDMQTGLSPFLSGVAPADAAATYQHAQNIDLLWQTLGSLSHVLDQAAMNEGSLQPIDMETVVNDLPLAALAARLRGHDLVGSACGGGEMDFF